MKNQYWRFNDKKFFVYLLFVFFFFISYRTLAQEKPWVDMNGAISTSFNFFFFDSSGIFYSGTNNGLFSSRNYGDSWNRINVDISAQVFSFIKAADSTLIISASAGILGGGTFRSTDLGKTWVRINILGFSSFAFAADGKLYGRKSTAIYVSPDSGVSWSPRPVTYNGVRRTVYDMAINSDDSLFIVTNVGVFRSGNGGTTWTHLSNGFPDVQCWSLINTVNGILVAAADSCVYVSTDKGNSWQRKNIAAGSVKFLASASDSVFYAGVPYLGLYRTMNGGASWSDVTNNLPFSTQSMTSLAVAHDNDSNEIVFTGIGNTLFKSTDRGTSWQSVSHGLLNTTVRSLIVAKKNLATVFAGVDGKGIFRFLPLDSQWVEVYHAQSNVHFNTFSGAQTLFAGTDSIGILRSTDGGEHWNSSNSGLPFVPIFALAVLDSNIVIAGTKEGVYRSSDNGTTWNASSSAIGTATVNALIAINQDTVFAGTADGLFLSNNAGVGWTQISFAGKNVSSLVSGYEGELFASTPDGVFLSYSHGSSWGVTGSVGGNAAIRGLAVVDIATVAAATDQGVFITKDDGITWKAFNRGLPDTNVLSVVVQGDNILAGTSSGVFFNFCNTPPDSIATSIRWMDIGSFQSWYSSLGCEYEEQRVLEQQDGGRWPAVYPLQDMVVSKGLWIGVRNWEDANGIIWPYKVVHLGPRYDGDASEFIPLAYTATDRIARPQVTVNGNVAYNILPEVDNIDQSLKEDRIIYDSVNTAIGLTMVRKIIGFAQQYHDNYIIYDYTFTNTGNTNAGPAIELPDQTLDSIRIFFQYRYAICKETRYVIGSNSSGWGIGLDIDTRGDGLNPASTFFGSVVRTNTSANADNDIRAQYAWLGNYNNPNFGSYSFPGMPGLGVAGAPPSDNIGGPIWGKSVVSAPGPTADDTVGRLGAAQFIGVATLYSDKSATDPTDDPNQPSTTVYISSDDQSNIQNSQFNNSKMQLEYALMSSGHGVGWINGAVNWSGERLADKIGLGGDPSQFTTGGMSIGNGYGPYTLSSGQSLHIVIAEAAAGLSREACIRMGRQFKLGAITAAQKDDSVYTGRDSLFQTFKRALSNYRSGYAIPRSPDPPTSFTVNTAGHNISLSWAVPNDPKVQGFEIYRAESRIDSAYHRIYSCDPSVLSYTDEAINPGVSYYYYIVSVGDSASNSGAGLIPAGRLSSNRYFTQTYIAASVPTVVEPGKGIPRRFALEQNYPNPFNPATTFRFEIASRSYVVLRIYDALGREVTTLINETMDPGVYTSVWNAGNYASGVYFYRLTAGSFVQTRKLLLLK